VYYVADQPSVTIADLITHLRRGLGREPDLFAAPQGTVLLPRSLRTAFEIDDSAFRAAYANASFADVAQALAETARNWKNEHK
jgi:hypothetical protein